MPQRAWWVAGLGFLAAALAWQSGAPRSLVFHTLADAYIQVSAFVAATLALTYGLERWLNVDVGTFLERHARWQVPAAAMLGALPGCGGAVVAVTQYVRGHASFGSVVAVLTATMGDAAFLLLAQEPMTGLAVFLLGFAVGVVSGWIVDAIHGPDFMRQRRVPRTVPTPARGGRSRTLRRLNGLWLALMAPGLILAILSAFQVDTDAVLGTALLSEPTLWLGVAGSLLAVAMWALGPSEEAHCAPGGGGTLERVIGDTNFVTTWVVLSYLGYELFLFVTGIDLSAVFAAWGAAAPLLGILVGFLPGCGPQVVVTTLYLDGALPFAALLGNAISNDGDALFPAIAMAPRAAAMATLYSAVPAFLVAYGYFWLWG